MANEARDILFKARPIIEDMIKKEARAQGHYLTGSMEDSLRPTYSSILGEDILQGEMAYYANILNNGVSPARASFKQFPFLIKYWIARGLAEGEAKRAAAATIRKWMKEGMPTAASSRFSSNGKRTNFLNNALAKAKPRAENLIKNSVRAKMKAALSRTKSGTF